MIFFQMLQNHDVVYGRHSEFLREFVDIKVISLHSVVDSRASVNFQHGIFCSIILLTHEQYLNCALLVPG